MQSLQEQLSFSLKENNSGANRKKWAARIIENQINLVDLVELIHAEYPVAMRFSWLIGDLCEQKPELVFPTISYFFSARDQIKIKNFDRSLAKLFWLSGVPSEIESEVIDELFKWLHDPKITVSTKNYSLFALQKLTVIHPELKNELRIVIEDQLGKNSSSFEKRAGVILGEL